MKRTLACLLAVLLLMLPLTACQNEETPSAPVSTAESTPASEAETSSTAVSSAVETTGTIVYTGTPGDSAWPANVPMPLEELIWGMSPEEVENALAAHTTDGQGSKRNMDHNAERLTGIKDYSTELYGLPVLLDDDDSNYALELDYALPIGYNGDEPGARLSGVSLRLKTDDPEALYNHMVSLYGEPTEAWMTDNELGERISLSHTLVDACTTVYFWKPTEGLSSYDEKVQCLTLAAYRWYYGRYEGPTDLEDITEMGPLLPEDVPMMQQRYSELYDGYITLAVRSDKDITADPHVVVCYHTGPKVLVDLGEKYLSYFDE